MRKPSLQLIVVLAISSILIYILFGAQQARIPRSFTVSNKTYSITSYAITAAEQEKGLMNATVTNTTFMLFVFSKAGIYPFWMKDTYSQLDIIWIYAKNGTGAVVYVANATPCVTYDPTQQNCVVYTPTNISNYVIEAKADFAERNNVEAGATIIFSN